MHAKQFNHVRASWAVSSGLPGATATAAAVRDVLELHVRSVRADCTKLSDPDVALLHVAMKVQRCDSCLLLQAAKISWAWRSYVLVSIWA